MENPQHDSSTPVDIASGEYHFALKLRAMGVIDPEELAHYERGLEAAQVSQQALEWHERKAARKAKRAQKIGSLLGALRLT